MQIRTATDADAEPLRRYAEALFSEDLPGIFRRDAPTLQEEVEFIRTHLRPENATMLLAEEGGRIIGLLAFMGRERAEERHAGEFGLSVAEGYRGRGIGTALIGALLAWAPEHGISRVEVASWSTNPGATRLYQRLGFVEEGLARSAVMRDGKPIDVYMMAQLLS